MKSELHFWELPEKTMFWLKKDFWHKLYSFKKKETLTWKNVAEKLEINSGTLSNYISQFTGAKKAQYLPLLTLIKISNYLQIPRFEVENFIMKVKYGKNGKPVQITFPIDFLSRSWGSMVGALLAEGYISCDFGVGFWNKDEEIRNNFKILARRIVKEGLIEKDKLYACFFPAIFGQILIGGLAFKVGDKTKKDVEIPSLYLGLERNCKNDKILQSLLSWMFTGDGWVTTFKDHLRQTHRNVGIGFGSKEKDKPSQLLMDVIFLLDKFGIKYSKPFLEIKKSKNKLSYFWKIFIKGRKNLVNFKERVGFQSTRKQKILEDIIQKFEKPKLGDNESLFMVINSVKETCTTKEYATKHDVCEKTKLSEKWIERILKRAVDEGHIEVIGGGDRCKTGYGKLPYFYRMVG